METTARVVPVYDWLYDNNSGAVNAYHMALRLLQSHLGQGRSNLAAIPARIADTEVRCMLVHSKLLQSTKRVRSMWERIDMAGNSVARTLPNKERKNYQRVVEVTREVATHKRGAHNTFYFGFKDPESDDAYIVGVAAFQEPKDKLRGIGLEELSLEGFERLFIGKGGRLVTADVPPYVHERLGLAFPQAERLFDDNAEAIYDTEETEAAA